MQIRHFRISCAQILRWVMLLYTWVWQSRRNNYSFYSAGLSKVKIRASLYNKTKWPLFIIAWRSPNFDFRWSIKYSKRKTYDNVPFGSMTLIWCLFFYKFYYMKNYLVIFYKKKKKIVLFQNGHIFFKNSFIRNLFPNLIVSRDASLEPIFEGNILLFILSF